MTTAFRNTLMGVLLAVVFLAGCGGGGSGSTATTQASAVVSSSGGTVAVSDASSPINGFKMTIPEGALSDPTTITVQTTDEKTKLPSTFNVSGKTIRLLPSGLTFSSPIELTIPYAGDIPPTVVTHNSETGVYSTLPTTSVDAQNKTITVTTNHFTDAERTYISSYPTITTGFKLDEDTFKITNSPTYLAEGCCWGFVYYAKWYYENMKSKNSNLHGAYSEDVEKFIVISAQNLQNNFRTSTISMLMRNDVQTFHNLYTAMSIHKNPQMLSMISSDLNWDDLINIDNESELVNRHSVLVYAITNLQNGMWRLDINDNRDNSQSYPLYFDGSHFIKPWDGSPSSLIHNFRYFSFDGDRANELYPHLTSIYNKAKIYGNYTGSYSGYSSALNLSIAGVWNIIVNTDDTITGAGSGNSENFAITGTYSEGRINFRTSGALSNGSIFGGTINSQGVVTGTWYLPNTDLAGSFTGTKTLRNDGGGYGMVSRSRR